MLAEAPTGERVAASLSHIEHSMCVAELLESWEEFERWALLCARVLAKDSRQAQLRGLCTRLLGPPGGHPDTRRHHPILKRVLNIMASNRALQRLVTEFTEVSRRGRRRGGQRTPWPGGADLFATRANHAGRLATRATMLAA